MKSLQNFFAHNSDQRLCGVSLFHFQSFVCMLHTNSSYSYKDTKMYPHINIINAEKVHNLREWDDLPSFKLEVSCLPSVEKNIIHWLGFHRVQGWLQIETFQNKVLWVNTEKLQWNKQRILPLLKKKENSIPALIHFKVE